LTQLFISELCIFRAVSTATLAWYFQGSDAGFYLGNPRNLWISRAPEEFIQRLRRLHR